MSPRVFTIPASVPFLPTLVAALAHGALVPGYAFASDPLALARATLYLPTRRACGLARDVFLDVVGADALILPRIVALGEIDDDEIAFADAASGAALALPKAIEPLERRLLLARLVRKWADQLAPAANGDPALIVGTPASALALADDLARLIDDMTTREVSWGRLDGLVPDHVDKYWQLTLDFLKIARTEWPNILAEREAIEPAARRDRLLAAEAARLAANPDAPVIVAGSTGSMPATAKFIATVARLPHGAVVLPGLDTDLDEESWTSIGGVTEESGGVPPAYGHPQFALQALLARLALARRDVMVLGAPPPHARERLVSEALRPAETTDLWPQRLAAFGDARERGLADLALIEAANAEEEALAVAVVLREAVETPGRSAALVTPDRALARRVMAALGRWGIAADDSGGDPLADTPAGAFARLAADAALGELAPVALLALLKHPAARLGAPEGGHRRAIAALERAILRGPRPRPGTAGLAHALDYFGGELAKLGRGERCDLHPADPRARVAEADLAAAQALVARLTEALAPLERVDARAPHSFTALAHYHRDVIVALGKDDADDVVFAGADGRALQQAFDDIARDGARADLTIAAAEYAELFRAVLADRVVRRGGAPDARVHIFGPLEARLTDVDRVVLGGLAEGVWPPETRTDPWLSRPMRHDLGLDLPERRIGLSAHDFAQLLGAGEVVLTRPAKIAGAPVVASRFLQRLAAVAGDKWREVVERGERYLALARELDRPQHAALRVKAPAPRPPRAARPTALSVTEIEHWLRDPYTIYAKHILRLDRLDPVDMPPGAADRGSAIHGAVGDFAKEFVESLPADPTAELLRIGRAHFLPLDDYPEAKAFWWPRFARIAHWFAAFERARRGNAAATRAEIRGEIALDLGGRQFRLTARADRIEKLADGRYAILDFKTGAPPTDKQVRAGVAPQLTLEGAILRRGGFPDIPAGASLAELVYVKLKGGYPPGEVCDVDFKELTADGAADHALAKLADLARRFEDEATPYRSLVLSMWKTRYGAYDDLARVKEWSVGGDGGEE
jgi:ATP-dependent helicase/nuclease subunit B